MLGRWLRRLAAVFIRGRLDAELDEEIRIHLEMATEEYARRGLSLEDAMRAAQTDFGHVDQLKERHREARALFQLADALRDLQLAARALRKDRAFTATVVLTLSVAIGVNAAVFSVAVATAPVPERESSRECGNGPIGRAEPAPRVL